LHDTPQKYLFDQSNPTFSHGCIRIQEPVKLANFLLRDEIDFSDKKVQTLINQKHEKHIRLKNKVPIFIAYFTAWVDKNGKLNFRHDIYKHDQKMKMLLFEN
jgi:murein L,D-transpeptidase YcbB/YkuD